MISVIIPVYNETLQIVTTLQTLLERASGDVAIEIIVVDGGSTDDTLDKINQCISNWAVAKTNSKISLQLINSKKGRAVQLCAGAQQAVGDILYFLHADSYPPKDFDQLILKAVAQGHPAGCFKMRFRDRHWWLAIICWFTRFNWRASRGGDQSQYITRSLYNEIGGYNSSLPMYEDYDLIHKLYDQQCYHVIPATITSSARRYREKGVFTLQWHYLMIYYKKWRGASIDDLHVYYKRSC